MPIRSTASATARTSKSVPASQNAVVPVRLVEEGVATPEDVDRAFKAGMGFRYGTIGIFEFIDWGGVDILYRASGFLAEALRDDRFQPARLVEEKIARNELGPKTGRGFFDYAGDARERFETEKVRALLRRLKQERQVAAERAENSAERAADSAERGTNAAERGTVAAERPTP